MLFGASFDNCLIQQHQSCIQATHQIRKIPPSCIPLHLIAHQLLRRDGMPHRDLWHQCHDKQLLLHHNHSQPPIFDHLEPNYQMDVQHLHLSEQALVLQKRGRVEFQEGLEEVQQYR